MFIYTCCNFSPTIAGNNRIKYKPSSATVVVSVIVLDVTVVVIAVVVVDIVAVSGSVVVVTISGATSDRSHTFHPVDVNPG